MKSKYYAGIRGSLLLAMLASTFNLCAKDLTLYVAPNGNDQWSGQMAEPAADGKDGPLATLPAALQAVRKARQEAGPNGLEGKASILLREGTYELAKPLTLTPDDSGASLAQPLIIGAYPGEKPTLSGGRRLTGWKRVEGKDNLWSLAIPAVPEGKWYFRQLFVNGQRKQRARTPTTGFFRIQGESPQGEPVKLKFKPGDIKKEWARPGDVEVVALMAWADFRLPIRQVDEENHIATLAGRAAPSNRENNARYYIENAPDGLDTPGEWYLDRHTGIVTYWAESGEDRSQAEVIAPRLTELLRIEGDFAAEKPVRYVELRGLTFAHTDWTLGDQGYTDTQAAVHIRGNLFAEGAVDFVVEDCVFKHLAGYALEFAKGCQRVTIVGNEMVDIGAGGVRLGETAKRQKPFEQNHHNLLTDNDMHQLGRVFAPAVGVLVLQSGQNRIAHNHIHDLYYTAISVGWNWGYQETPCRDNLIEFNHLHDVGQEMLSDMGAIYTLGIQRGTILRNNWIHDVNAFTYGGWGLYTDEGSSYILLESNVVYQTKSAGFHQHYGRENVVRNNIFALGKEHQLMRTRVEPHLSFLFDHNIVYFNSGDLLGSNWAEDQYWIDYNLYFDARPGATPDSMRFAGMTLPQWRQHGHDLHSVIADPLFVDAAKFDFRLQPDSPALKLGFKSIDVSQAGVRKKTK